MDTTRYVHHRLQLWATRARGAEARCAELTTLCDELTARLEAEKTRAEQAEAALMLIQSDLVSGLDTVNLYAASRGHEEKTVGRCDHRLVFDAPMAGPDWLKELVGTTPPVNEAEDTAWLDELEAECRTEAGEGLPAWLLPFTA